VRPRDADAGLEVDFPKALGGRAAKDQVLAELDRIDPRWRRLFVVYPTERTLRDSRQTKHGRAGDVAIKLDEEADAQSS
jgi:hypothetical protein